MTLVNSLIFTYLSQISRISALLLVHVMSLWGLAIQRGILASLPAQSQQHVDQLAIRRGDKVQVVNLRMVNIRKLTCYLQEQYLLCNLIIQEKKTAHEETS